MRLQENSVLERVFKLDFFHEWIVFSQQEMAPKEYQVSMRYTYFVQENTHRINPSLSGSGNVLVI